MEGTNGVLWFDRLPPSTSRLCRHDRALMVAELRRRIAAARHVIRTAGRYRHSARKDARQMLAHSEARLKAIGVKP